MTIVRVAIALAALLVAPVIAQVDVSGEWAATLSAPRGALEYTMYLKQEGPRVTGYFQSEYGEIPLKGRINNDAITLSWELPDAKKPIDVTMTGKVNGDVIDGEATLAGVGKGSFRAERTGS